MGKARRATTVEEFNSMSEVYDRYAPDAPPRERLDWLSDQVSEPVKPQNPGTNWEKEFADLIRPHHASGASTS